MPEMAIAVGTGMRKSEQYGLVWKRVDFNRKEVHLARTKNGDPRDIPMSAAVWAAFQKLKLPNAKPQIAFSKSSIHGHGLNSPERKLGSPIFTGTTAVIHPAHGSPWPLCR